ncbi:hypothetical protein A9Q79_08035 [Methylophaga sp. 42_25_T18]|nr:hypothetical protein A9Q79_08035 [Methylophaga sp. 42_25_T18]
MELDAFYSAGDYWDTLIPESSIQRVHESCQAKNRVLLCKAFLENQELKILDIGAGHGFISSWCDELPKNSVVQYDFIEPDTDKRDEILQRSTNFTVNTKTSLDSCNDKYDLIFLNHVLEHVEDPVVFLNEVKSVLNKGGLLYIEVPHNDHLHKLDVFPHTLFFNINSLAKIATQLGLEIVSTQSFGSNNQGVLNRCISQLNKAAVYFKLEKLQHYFDAKQWEYNKSSVNGIWLNIILKA